MGWELITPVRMQGGFLVLGSHEVCDDVATLGPAAAVAEPFAAYVTLDHIFSLVQTTVAARMCGNFLGVGKEVIVLERLLEVQFHSFAGCNA